MREGGRRRREKKGQGERERETSICCSAYLCIHWLLLVCALTGDGTHNLGVLGGHFNQLSYLSRARPVSFELYINNLYVIFIT